MFAQYNNSGIFISDFYSLLSIVVVFTIISYPHPIGPVPNEKLRCFVITSPRTLNNGATFKLHMNCLYYFLRCHNKVVLSPFSTGGRSLSTITKQRIRDEGTCSSSFPHPGRIACCPEPDSRPPAAKALHTICGNNTSIVSNSWWWAYNCPNHVEQTTSLINHSVASSWFSFLSIITNCLFKFNYISKTEKSLETYLICMGYCPSVPVLSPYSSRRHAGDNKNLLLSRTCYL